MSQKSSSLLKKFALFVLLPIAIVKLFWSGVLFFLDKDALNAPKEGDFIYHYNINLAKNIIGTKQKTTPPKQEVQTHNRIDDIKLKGTYSSEDESFIIIEDNLGTTFLYKNEKYVGYKLIEIYDERAVLEKDGIKYDIILENSDKKSANITSKSPSRLTREESEAVEFSPGVPTSITRAELNTYVKNPNKIWKNIRIQELRQDGSLNGFRVNYVKKGSFFEKSGLKSGDVIKSIDGKELKSLADVMRYYNDIDSLEALTLSVKRGEDELDLEFNVN